MSETHKEEPRSDQAQPAIVDRIARAILLTVLGLVSIIAVGFLFVAQPSADDWCRGAPVSPLNSVSVAPENATTLNVIGGFAYLKGHYFGWTGRWAGIGLAIFSMSVLDPTRHYWLLLALLAAFHVAAVGVLFRALLREHLPSATVWLATISFLVLFWAAMPSPGQAVYWLTGGIENILGVSLSLMLLAGLISYRRAGAAQPMAVSRLMRYGGLPLLAIVATGIHELFGLLLCIVLAIGTAISFRVRHPGRWLWGAVTLAAGMGLLFVVSAPGNYVRARELVGGQNLKLTLLAGTRHLVECVIGWALDPKLLCATLIFVFHPAIRRLNPSWLGWARIRWRQLIPAAWICVVLIPFYAVVWIKGRVMDDRTLTGTYFVFILGWFASLFVLTRPLAVARSADADLLMRAVVLRILPIAFAVSLIFTGNTRVAISDLTSGRGVAWRAAMRGRDQEIRLAAKRGEAEFAFGAMPECPHILYDNEFFDAPGTSMRWRNECLGAFYGLKLVWQDASRRQP